jgi:hypothetical protein
MYRIKQILAAVLVIAITFPLCASALNRYKIELNKNDFTISNFEGYTKIEGNDAFATSKVGYPELSIKGFKYYLPSDIHVTGIKIIRAEKEKIPGYFNIYPVQKMPLSPEEPPVFTPQDSAIYASASPYPGKAADFVYAGYMRGHQLSDIVVYPFEYIPASRELYFYSLIEFEFVTDGINQNPLPKMLDPSTIDDIQKIVQNKDEIHTTSLPTASKINPRIADSIPMVIITEHWGWPWGWPWPFSTEHRASPFSPRTVQMAFEDYAYYKKCLGVNVEVMGRNQIDMTYTGGTIQERIRNYIKDKYLNNYTRWVLFGGDINIVPAAFLQSFHDSTLSDFYYACLDGTWDNDGDGLLGETTIYGDTADYYPEVYVGRIPCRTFDEAYAVINKIKRYQKGDPSHNGYETKALLISSSIMNDHDGQDYANNVKAAIPPSFTITQYHNGDSSSIKSAMESGQGIIVFYGHSGGSGNILLRNWFTCPSCRQWLYSTYFDNMNTGGRYSIFLNSTCFNNNLENDTAISRSFMLNPNGGGVGYIGPTDGEVAWSLRPFHKKIFDELFDSRGGVPLGEAVANAELLLIPQDLTREYFERLALYSYILLGDPQLEVWRESPKVLSVYPQPSQIIAKVQTNIKVTVWGDKVCAAGAFVSFIYNGDYIAGAYADANGIVDFGDYSFDTTGSVIFVVSKSGYYVVEDTMAIRSLGGGGRGDVNLNGIANEIGDAVVFASYFINGLPALVIDQARQIAATDINGDGIMLSLADFVCLTRITVGDALPLAKSASDLIAEFYSDGTSVRLKTPVNVGAALFVFEGEVYPTVGTAASGMEINYAHVNGTTRTLVYSMERGHAITSGEVLNLFGQSNLISVEAATYEGAILATNKDFQLPTKFELSQNYPNPFNQSTQIRFGLSMTTHVRLAIYNIAGQLVRTLADAVMESGSYEVTWNGDNNAGETIASGIYFCKMEAGEFKKTVGMILLK